MPSLDLAVIGNCAVSALIDRVGTVVWAGLPRLDSDPVFHSLLNGEQPWRPEDPANGGYFSIELIGMTACQQHYLYNSAVVSTRLTDGAGNVVDILDFAPRFPQFDRMFRPPMLVRRLIPVSGQPRVRIRVRPRFDYGAVTPQVTVGSNHLRYQNESGALRLTTDAPLSYVMEETSFVIDRPLSLFFGPDEGLNAGIEDTARRFLERTLDHWRSWVRALSIPFEWQEAVIRAAITLKLCNFEETGAIVAALTTSIPEAPMTQRNWDYRLCWLRDAYFVVHALNRLGTTRTMEDYLAYITDIVAEGDEHTLKPCYAITRNTDLGERVAPALPGYRGMGPVRVGNEAHLQIQNDVYGSVVLAATHAFFDLRLGRVGDPLLFDRMEELGRRAVAVYDKPDAGPWELRNKPAVHTFSALMCWAACDRLAKIADMIGRSEQAAFWRAEATRLHADISRRAWNPQMNSFVATFDGDYLDATLLLLHELDFLATDDPRFAATVEAVGAALKRGDLLLRYAVEDDFGSPQTAFTICTFWYIDALAALGRRDEARTLFTSVLERRSSLGLLSEDIHPVTGELWGNFPQTYSMVGLINSAVRLSKHWEDAF